MKNEIQNNQTTEIMDFPYGWNKVNIPFTKCTLFADQVHPFR